MTDKKARRAAMAARTLEGILTLSMALASHHALAQTTYHDPQGRFEFQVPEGWKAAPDEGVDQVVVRRGASQATIAVIQQQAQNAMTAKQFVDENVRDFQGQCPTFKERKNGPVEMVGGHGAFALVTCSDPRSPAAAETSSVLTANLFVVGFTAIAPLRNYYADLPILDAIRNSLNVTNAGKVLTSAGATRSQAVSELDKACEAGAFVQEDCARRMGILLGQEGEQEKEAVGAGTASASNQSAGNVYRDAAGRFSLQIPSGWSATAEGENGSLGVQLRAGADWINVMPAEPAASASQVVLNQEQKIATHSNSGRKPPFGSLGLIQLFGNGLEVTYDHFSGSSAQGDTVESYIGGVGDIAGSGKGFLLLVSSTGAAEKDKNAGIFISVAQSIHLGAH